MIQTKCYLLYSFRVKKRLTKIKTFKKIVFLKKLDDESTYLSFL